MNETHDIIAGTIGELEDREAKLEEQIQEVQVAAKAELKDVRKALTALRRQAGASANGNGASEPVEVTDSTKDAVMAALAGGVGARPAKIANQANLNEAATRAALDELVESGDLENYGKGLYREAQ